MNHEWMRRLAPWTLTLIAACRPSGPAEESQQVAPVVVPAAPAITDGAGPWVLRYFAPASGELVAVKTVADVPEGARGQVLVTYEDPALQGPWVYVADLTKKTGSSFAVTAVARAELEVQRMATAAASTAEKPAEKAGSGSPTVPANGVASPNTATSGGAAQQDHEVIIYRTTWCGYCKKAAEYLRLKGVAFVEKDLERDPGAREDMLARARKAGVPPQRLQGVPILSVRGRVIPGFDRGAIDRALGT